MIDRLLKENPGDITARITNGRLLAIKGNTADAIVVLREVVKDAPENPQAHYILGQVLRESKDMPGAKNELQEVQPDSAEQSHGAAGSGRGLSRFSATMTPPWNMRPGCKS